MHILAAGADGRCQDPGRRGREAQIDRYRRGVTAGVISAITSRR